MAGRLKLLFRQATTPKSTTVGGLEAVRFEGALVRTRAGGPVIATHADHNWLVGDELYFRLDCEELVYAHFEGASGSSERFGPYTHFSSADGIVYMEHAFFARLEERTSRWYSHAGGEEWPVLVVAPG